MYLGRPRSPFVKSDYVTAYRMKRRSRASNRNCSFSIAVVASGVKIIEIGAFVHPKAVPQMADTDALCRAMNKVDGVEYRALVPNIKGVQRAFDAGLTKAKLAVSASEAHCLANFNSTPVKMVEGFADCVEFAVQNQMTLSGAISTSFGCPFQGRVPVEQVENVVRQLRQAGYHRTVPVGYHRHGQPAPSL